MLLGDGHVVYGGPDADYTSWGGGPPTYDRNTGRWVFFVTEIADHCGLSEWKVRSTIVKTSGETPAGPFSRDSTVIGVQAHNPYYMRDQVTGKHILFHIGSGREGAPERFDCANGTTPAAVATERAGSAGAAGASSSSSSAASKLMLKGARSAGTSLLASDASGAAGSRGRSSRAVNASRVLGKASVMMDGESANGYTAGTPTYVLAPQMHVADSLDGPWGYMQAAVPRDSDDVRGAEEIKAGADNPAPFMFANGSVLMLSRSYNQEEHISQLWVSVAPGLGGPYRVVRDAGVFSPSSFSEEDPCIYMDQRGHFHALFHFTHGHAYSIDGLYWHWGTEDAWAGNLHGVPVTDSERPRVWINYDTKRPELLFFASGGAQVPTQLGLGQKGMTLVRPIGAEGIRKWSMSASGSAGTKAAAKAAAKASMAAFAS